MRSVFTELKYSPELLNSIFLSIILIAGYNATGVMITKFASSTQRTTIDNAKTLIIWLAFLSTGDEKFIWLELFGFIILVLGTFIYNEIIEIPIDFMRRNTVY
jgi:membrane-associated phospholipid phosphatase